jgi:hypothetical protein
VILHPCISLADNTTALTLRFHACTSAHIVFVHSLTPTWSPRLPRTSARSALVRNRGHARRAITHGGYFMPSRYPMATERT